MAVLSINGIRSDGSQNTDKLAKQIALAGHETLDVNYPQINLFHVTFMMRGGFDKFINTRVKYVLDARQSDQDDAIAHSAGCLLNYRAMLHGARFRHVFWFAPALDADVVIPSWGCETLHIIFNPEDRAIKLGTWLRWHAFGAMGIRGHDHAHLDDRIHNIEAKPDWYKDWFRHSYSFEQQSALIRWAGYYQRVITKHSGDYSDDHNTTGKGSQQNS